MELYLKNHPASVLVFADRIDLAENGRALTFWSGDSLVFIIPHEEDLIGVSPGLDVRGDGLDILLRYTIAERSEE
ncbi:MAG: hypothetical protein F4X98_14915 [Gammaproteobacteria bacterium]|nr:hypothetical protein [Gammaproteobacteria bacterium]